MNVKILINKILGKIKYLRHVSLIKSIYINFKCLNWKQAYKLPIILSPYVELRNIKRGSIEIKANNVHMGLIEWCHHQNEQTAFKQNSLLDLLNGKLIVEGNVAVGAGSAITARFGGTITLGNNVEIGHNTKILCRKSIHIKKETRISWECQICDTNFHPYIDLSTNTIPPKEAPIAIGSNCWLGNKVIINKGAYVADNTIIASNSFYTTKENKAVGNSIYAGTPATIIKTNIKTITAEQEAEMNN